MDLRIRMGSSMLVIGPSTSGKTVFVMKLIASSKEVFDTTPSKVYWCYGHKTKLHTKMIKRGYNMIQGVPKNFDFVTPNSIIVLDDLMTVGANDDTITSLFIQGAHHVPCFVIALQQNMFPKGREGRTRHLNTQYIVLFKNPRDKLQITYLERQMYPQSRNFLTQSYREATEQPYTYLFIDLHQQTPEIVRIRAQILPSQRPMVAYVDKQQFGDIALLNKTLVRQ